jgi:hypothetical protein
MSLSIGFSFTTALFLIFFARSAYLEKSEDISATLVLSKRFFWKLFQGQWGQ